MFPAAQYCSLSLLREMLLVLEAAEASPNEHDSKAADSLQRRCESARRGADAVPGRGPRNVCSGFAAPKHATLSPRGTRRLLHDDMKETGLLPVLCKSAKTFNARQVSHAHAIDIIMVREPRATHLQP